VARNTAVGVGRAEGETENSRRLSRSNGESGRHSEFSLFCVRLAAAQVSLSVHTQDLQYTARQLPTSLARHHSLSARRLMLVFVLYQQPTTVLHPDELQAGKLVTMAQAGLGPLGPPRPEARRSSIKSCHSLPIHPSASLSLPRPTPGLFNQVLEYQVIKKTNVASKRWVLNNLVL
jgi:hypothetical protein